MSHGFLRDLGPQSLCVYRAYTDPTELSRKKFEGISAWEYLKLTGAAHEPWEEYHHQFRMKGQNKNKNKKNKGDGETPPPPPPSSKEKAQMHERQRLKNLMTAHNSHLPARHPANFAFEVALRDPLRSVLFFGGPLANVATARFLAFLLRCRGGRAGGGNPRPRR